jgi:hypothetical protein
MPDRKLGKKVRSSGSNSNVGRYIYTDTGKGKLRLSFLKLIVRSLLPTTASSGRSERCIRYMAIALQRTPSSKLKSPHLDYSPDRESRIKVTMRELIRYAKTPRYPCNTQSPQLGFNELDVQFSRSKRGPERIASVHAALERSEAAGLYYGSERKILKQAVLEFLVHGLRYVFYAQPGPKQAGTANCTFCARH